MKLAAVLNWSVILFSAIAAGAWLRSATAKVLTQAQDGELLFMMGDQGERMFVIDGVDLLATTALQSKWNRIAAFAACLAALSQAIFAWVS